MTFKPGDLVIMNNKGFSYYGNPNNMFETSRIVDSVNGKNFTWAFCQSYAILGVGEVLSINTEMDSVEVKFKNSIKGIYYFNTMFYEASDLSKLSLFQKLKYKLLGRV